MKRLEEKTAIITGSASGIGRAAALLFASEGARVVVADVDEAGGGKTVELIRESGGAAFFIRTDVSRAASTMEMAREAVARYDRIDVLYNNAAATRLCNEQDRAVHDLDEEVWDKMMAICLKGVFLCSKAVLPHMRERRQGVILNTTSTVAHLPEPGFASYTAAKGGVMALTRAMAVECASHGIRVNALCPGYVITECQDWYQTDDAARKRADAMHLTRIGRPEDIAQMALHLAAESGAFITGAEIVLDGGYTSFKGTCAFRQEDRHPQS